MEKDAGEATALPPQATCLRCGRALEPGSGYRLAGVRRCLWCTLRHRPLLRRSLLTAAVVGTVLTGINQGPELVSGALVPALAWKIPLTYAVPFCVATWGALINSRV